MMLSIVVMLSSRRQEVKRRSTMLSLKGARACVFVGLPACVRACVWAGVRAGGRDVSV